ncbi:Cellulase [Aphelenchoides besseyi]|nr:Cellulase [Aphelenchoides besseyi]
MVKFIVLFALLPLAFADCDEKMQTGHTTRYWDCCKQSCGWKEHGSFKNGPVQSCDIHDNPLNDNGNTRSSCDNNGGAYTCSNQQPWAVNDTFSYGFAAVKFANSNEAGWCCGCYQMEFTSGPVAGKTMLIQATNTGDDYEANHFDIAMPGGGVGMFNGCSSQYNAPSQGWGEQYGGISSRDECDQLPAVLRPGCQWRFDWFKNAANPTVSFKKVKCPVELTSKTKCIRSDE